MIFRKYGIKLLLKLFYTCFIRFKTPLRYFSETLKFYLVNKLGSEVGSAKKHEWFHIDTVSEEKNISLCSLD